MPQAGKLYANERERQCAIGNPQYTSPMTTPDTLLRQVFGYHTFRPHQREVIDLALAGRDVLAVMPTGGGKSLCYQIPALLLPGLTVVVSPLIALMQDQVAQLHAAGVSAVALNSALPPATYAANMHAVRTGSAKLLYVAPETLFTPRVQDLLAAVPVSLLTVDEAHCISEWGHDFRPEYRQLAEARRRYPHAACLALTATATPRVRADIIHNLGLRQATERVASFDRANLFIEVVEKGDALAQTRAFLSRFRGQSGIIYCLARRQVDELAAYLQAEGFRAHPYHAGLDDATRQRHQQEFIRDDVPVMVATVAFGMGINKPDVRFVLHFDIPKSVENYYQEIGRAGRDGLPAHCRLLYSSGDAAKWRYFIDKKEPTERRAALNHLNAMARYAEDSFTCRRHSLLTYFGEAHAHQPCGHCDACRATPPTLHDITLPAQKFMSCIKRTGERFGAAHIIAVLRGSREKRVLELGHHTLSTYNIGADLSEKQWLALARQLIRLGYVHQDPEHRGLRLTPPGFEVLKNRTPITGQLSPPEKPATEAAPAAAPAHDPALFDLLRQTRKELADTAGVPPYIILPDQALVDMATYFPHTPASLLTMTGVGQVKASSFGAPFLKVIAAYCRARGLTERPKATSRRTDETNRRYMQVGRAYAAGASLADLQRTYGVSADTVLGHLLSYVLAGHPLAVRADVPALSGLTPSEQAEVRQAFAQVGWRFLKPVFEHLHGRFDYPALRAMQVVVASQAAVNG